MAFEVEIFLVRDEVCEFFDVFEDDVDREGEFEIGLTNCLDLGFVEEDIISLAIDCVARGDFNGHICAASGMNGQFLTIARNYACPMKATIMKLMLLNVIELRVVPIFRRRYEALKKVNSLKTLIFCHSFSPIYANRTRRKFRIYSDPFTPSPSFSKAV